VQLAATGLSIGASKSPGGASVWSRETSPHAASAMIVIVSQRHPSFMGRRYHRAPDGRAVAAAA
jgi:hypothetical protein